VHCAALAPRPGDIAIAETSQSKRRIYIIDYDKEYRKIIRIAGKVIAGS
jgi:hypothetical protein